MNGYVSNLLCHFCGKVKKPSEEEKFQLLLLIIKSGTLLSSLDPPNTPKTIMSPTYAGEHVGRFWSVCGLCLFL